MPLIFIIPYRLLHGPRLIIKPGYIHFNPVFYFYKIHHRHLFGTNQNIIIKRTTLYLTKTHEKVKAPTKT